MKFYWEIRKGAWQMTDEARKALADELKPCPFCGAKPAIKGGYLVYCPNDDCMGPVTTCAGLADNVFQWNIRQQSAPSQPGTLAREEVARIIDPIAFAKHAEGDYLNADLHYAREQAWKSIDAILALTSSHEAGTQDNATYKVGRWLSAALDDPQVCQEMKNDILAWMEAG